MNKKILFIVVCMLFFIPSFGSAYSGYSYTATNELKNCNVDENTPPNPPVISGPTSGKIRESYPYEFLLIDPDYGDFMYTLEIDFGDEIVTEGGAGCGETWLNGTVYEVTHLWMAKGDYEIRARVRDSFDAWSEWSEPFSVSMPKTSLISTIIQLMQHDISISEVMIYLNSFFN